jgi:NAD(P)-dependent dehydrogenase (short-subunit alcohol dehydrogenase family)
MCALNDKVVIVTGGSSGIGRAAALSFAKQGAKVIITARRAAPSKRPPPITRIFLAWSRMRPAPDDAARTIAKAVDTWGHLDVLVNNAGAGAILPLADATVDRIMKIFAVNVFGPSLLAAGSASLFSGGEGIDNQCIEHVRSQAGDRTLPQRCDDLF